MRSRPDGRATLALLVFLVAAGVFWRTAFPTITWWDSSSYSLASATLGVDAPPGSLILTLFGWPITRLTPALGVAHALNRFAGLLAALCATLVFIVALEALAAADQATPRRPTPIALAIGASLGALTFAFSDTLWEYAVRFTPYVLSAVFTGLILWTMLRCWRRAREPDAWKWSALLALLFGLDFNVHRTNALLIPAALVWMLLRNPRAFRSPRTIITGIVAFAAGISIVFLFIPMSRATHSPLNFNDTGTLSGLWDYLALKRLGGGFLLDVVRRKSPLWSYQSRDLVHVLGANFSSWTSSIGILGVLPAVAAVFGLSELASRSRRLAVAFLFMLLIQAALTVIYFNIPANFFRTFDRHYLPVCVSIAALVACGLAGAVERVTQWWTRSEWLYGAPVAVLVLLCPLTQLAANWSRHDASQRYFAHDYAVNALRELPNNAIFYTVGDNDTFPLWYVQTVEGVRPDVAVINLSIANIPELSDLLLAKDPTFPITRSASARLAMTKVKWKDTVIALPVQGGAEQLGLAAGTRVPNTISLNVTPMDPPKLIMQEAFVLDVATLNRWRRPLTYSITGGSATQWFTPYARLEGLYSRIVPQRDAPPDRELFRAHLLGAQLRGFADPHVRVDDFTPNMARQYLVAGQELLEADVEAGQREQCRSDQQQLLRLLAPERWATPGEQSQLVNACG